MLAARVEELRKPSIAAWTVNQLARRRELDVQRLLKAGEQLREAQADAMLGDGAEAFAEARGEESHALDRLLDGARDLLSSAGQRPTDATLDRIRATLRAAAVTDDQREALREGRLAQEVSLSGFEALQGLPLPKRQKSAPKRKQTAPSPPRKRRPSQADQRRERARAKLLEARADARDRAREAREADEKVDAARRALARAEAVAKRAKAQAERASERSAKAENELKRLS